MQRNQDKPEVNQDKLEVNYHKSDTVGAIGHASIKSTYNGDTASLSIYPSATPLFTPLVTLTVASFTSAKNVPIDDPESTPIVSTYEISKDLNSHKAAHEKIQNLKEKIKSGEVKYSLIPNTLTRSLHVITSKHVNTNNIYRGFKLMDRNLIDEETNKVDVTNCSHAVDQVLSAGGHKTSEKTFGYSTPTGINKLFQDKPNIHKNCSPVDTNNSPRNSY